MLLLTVHLSTNMSELRIKINAKPLLILKEVTRTLVRGESSSAVLTVNFENGVGQNIIKDTILFEEGTEGQENYSKVTINETKTLTGKGTFEIKVDSYPNIYQADRSITYTIDNGTGNLLFVYDSKPETSPIEIQEENRKTHTFTLTEFMSHITVPYGTKIKSISLSGDVSGFKQNLNGNVIDYVENTFISVDDISIGKLYYVPDDVDNAYEKTLTYSVKDSNGNISN